MDCQWSYCTLSNIIKYVGFMRRRCYKSLAVYWLTIIKKNVNWTELTFESLPPQQIAFARHNVAFLFKICFYFLIRLLVRLHTLSLLSLSPPSSGVKSVCQLFGSELGAAAAFSAVHQMDCSLNTRPCRTHTKHVPLTRRTERNQPRLAQQRTLQPLIHCFCTCKI